MTPDKDPVEQGFGFALGFIFTAAGIALIIMSLDGCARSIGINDAMRECAKQTATTEFCTKLAEGKR